MKIGQFNETFIPVIDGVARVMKAYADTLSARGNEVYVIAPLYDTGFRGGLPYEIVDYTSVQLSKKMPLRVGTDVFDPHFEERIRQIDLDICHVHCPGPSGNIGVHLAHKRNIPVVGSFHTKFYDDILEITKMKPLAKIGAKVVAEFYEKCDEVWAVSEGSGETLREYGYKGDVVVMPNGTNRRTLNVSRLPEIREKYGIRQDVPVILFVGQINWKKNLRRVIESCALLKKRGTKFQLVLAGCGPDEDEVRKLASDNGLDDDLIMTGHLTDTEALDCLYFMADLFLFPSIYDNAPMVLREAAAQHTVALAVAGSCTAEVISDMENGIIAENTTEDVCDKIESFLKLPSEKRSAMEENAYRTIPIPWDGPLMDNIVGRYQNLIDKYRKKS